MEKGQVTLYSLKLSGDARPTLVPEKSVPCGEDCFDSESVVRLAIDGFGLSAYAEEHVLVFAYNGDGRILGAFETSHGTADHSVVGVREIFVRLMLVGAQRFVVAHNHPSGNAKPSEDDFARKEELKKGAQTLGLELTDFLIVAPTRAFGDGKEYYSFAEEEKI